jgi:hypothetical protein
MKNFAQRGAGSITVTVLTCVSGGATATKTWRYDSILGKPVVVPFKAGLRFTVECMPIANIRELSALLTRLESEPHRFIVRGEPMPGLDLSQPVLRRKRSRGNEAATFREPADGVPFAMFDFDKIPVPSSIEPIGDPEGAAAHAVGLLPEPFQDASYHWQLSSSAGMGDGTTLSCHIWFWFDRCVTEKELTRWTEANRLPIDVAIFRTVQPHYTAAPIFERMRDPLPRRSGLHVGLSDTVEFPRVELQPQWRPVSTYAGGLDSDAVGFEAKLRQIGDPPGNPNGRGFHLPLLAATASYVGAHGRDGTDVCALKERLRQAILAAPKRAGRDQDIDRYLSDEYLDDIISGAVEKFGDRDCEVGEDSGYEVGPQDNKTHGLPPYYPPPTEPRDEALARQSTVIGDWFREMARLVQAWKAVDRRRAEAFAQEGLT